MTISVRVLTNTVVLYAKIIISTVVNLYLTRVVLDVLGIEDFGIYNLIAGVIALLAFVETALMSSTQRYLSFSLGVGDEAETRNLFSASLLIHIAFAVLLLLVLQLCGLFLFDGFLNIPEQRIPVAEMVYQLMIVSSLVTVLGIPFNAAINAYEDIWYYGFVQIVCVFLKLAIIWGFKHLTMDSLLIYTLWMALVTVSGVVASVVWCVVKYAACRHGDLSFRHQMSRIKEMIGFTGWNTLGAFSVVARNQGISIVLNIFFGPAINGVFGIANQVDGQLVSFANNLTSSLSPQIVKSQGRGDRERLKRLTVFASKLAFLLSAVFALPLMIELPLVLDVWLKEVPPYAETYCRLVLLVFLVCELYPGLSRGIQAVGQIKWQQIWCAALVVSPILVGILLFKRGLPHYYITYIMLAAQIASMSVVIYWSHVLYGLDVKKFLSSVLLSAVIFSLLYAGGGCLDSFLLTHTSDLVRFLSVCAATSIAFFALFYILVLDKVEKDMLHRMFKKILHI